jgi:hypothetical protein
VTNHKNQNNNHLFSNNYFFKKFKLLKSGTSREKILRIRSKIRERKNYTSAAIGTAGARESAEEI